MALDRTKTLLLVEDDRHIEELVRLHFPRKGLTSPARPMATRL